ncbi:LacI family DNA-binding transcriptional regulator [Microbacterium sp. NPDC055683]
MSRDESDASQAPAGRRLPTMRDLAAHVGVSRQLVSLVMRGAPGPSDESRRRILEAAEQIGYRPNASARLLRQSRTRLIGVHLQIENPFQARFVERLFLRAAEHGYRLVLGPLTVDRPTETVVAELIEDRVEALIAFNPTEGSPALESAMRMMPVVWLGEWTDAAVDNVHVDEREGLRLAVGHLADLGHARIAYAGGLGGRVGADRADAYRQAMDGAGLAPDVVETGFAEEDGAAAARALLARDRLPTALVCAGDQSAAGALAVLARAGVDVPAGISVVGFDDSSVAELSYHRLTTVHQDVDETVAAALGAVLARLDDPDRAPQRAATTAALVVRDTTAPPRVGA